MTRLLAVSIVLICSVLLGVCPAVGEEVDVYILAGQSNMDGRGLVEDLTTDHPEFAKARPEIKIWYANNAGEGYSTGWVDLAPGLSIPPKFTRGEGKLPSWTFGCELSFGPAIALQTKGRQVALIKVSRGGTSLKRDWAPDLKRDDALYPLLIETVKKAMASLKEQGHNATLKGMVWHQGEGDRKLKTYADHLAEFIAHVRKDLGQAELPFLIGEVFDNGERDLVRTAQRDVAQRVAATSFVTSEGLETSDGTHFTAASLLDFGSRFAKAMLRHTQGPQENDHGDDGPNAR